MSALSTTWYPNSFQLRLALNSRRSPAILERVRVQKLNREIRVLSVAGDGGGSGDGIEQSSKRNSWTNSSSSADTFAGWSGGDAGKESTESEKKSWPGGILTAGVAGIILVAGLTFATLSISKRNTSKLAQGMAPLTRQQEIMLAADDQNDRVEQEEKEGKDTPGEDDDVTPTGIDNDSSLPSEINESTKGNTQSESELDRTIHTADDSQNESAMDGKLVATHFVPGTPVVLESDSDYGSFVAPVIENSGGSLVAENSESPTEQKEHLIDAKPELNTDLEEVPDVNRTEYPDLFSTSSSTVDVLVKPLDNSDESQLPMALEHQVALKENVESIDLVTTNRGDADLNQEHVLTMDNWLSPEEHSLNGDGSMGKTSVSAVEISSSVTEQDANIYTSINESTPSYESPNRGSPFSSAGIPAPSVVSAASQVRPGKVMVPAVVDQVHGQALSALQVLKVIEGEIQPGDLCTRREYARWLVSASSILSRDTASKVYPAMYIENITELAFDDITPQDPDFPSIQGLAEAGLISSKLSRRDMSSLNEDQSSFFFFPESPLSRQDLVTWKMALEKRQLPEANRKTLHRISGFLDIDKIDPDACPALVADLLAGENGITALAFGFTRLFQPEKPVTKAQAAIALATGEASDMVSEELARIEADSMAEKAVAAHTALVAQVEKDVNASFEKELLLEREKVSAVEKLAMEAREELERLRDERERDGIALMKERAAVESEMEVLSRLRRELEEQMESLMSNKVELTYEKGRLHKLLKDAEFENQEISRLQHELEVERKALAMARAWAEDEAKRAREQAKVIEEARYRWEREGIKVVVDNDLREEENVGVTWVDASKHFSVEGTVSRGESLVDRLKAMAADVSGKAKITIWGIIKRVLHWVSVLKEWASGMSRHGLELKEASLSKMSSSLQELRQRSVGFTSSVGGGAKRVAEECKEGVERLTQKFKT